MKTFKVLLMMSCFFCLSHSLVFSQNFQKYQTWASENHQHDLIRYSTDMRVFRPIADHQNNVTNYEDVKHTVVGDFDGNGIVETALLIKALDTGTTITDPIEFYSLNHSRIFTIESRGYRVLEPHNVYDSGQVVNAQEGTNIDPVVGRTGEFTPHPTILRYLMPDSLNIFNTDSVKYAVAGDYDNNGKDEIAMLYHSGGALTLKLASNNATGNGLDYEFSITTIPYTFSLTLSQIRYVVTGNFDADASDEIAICYDDNINSKSQVILLQWIGGVWATTTVIDQPSSNFAYTAVRHAVAGDFDGDGRDQIALSYNYGYNDTSRQRIFISDNNWALSAVMDTVSLKFNLDRFKKMTAGDFDGDGRDEIAMFYDHPAKYEPNETTIDQRNLADSTKSIQEVFITDHQSPLWKFPSVIKEKNSNLDFKKIKFAFVGNFDYDVMHRDELSVMYMDQAYDSADGQKLGDNAIPDDKILTWLSLPKFTDNDFAITAKDINNVEKPFFPLGWSHVRLVTDKPGWDSLQHSPNIPGEPGEEVRGGKLPESTLANYAKIYNTVVPERWTYTDEFHYDKVNNTDSTSGSTYNYFMGYQAGLLAYLNKAGSLGLKVMPVISPFEWQNLDIDTSAADPHYKRTIFTGTSGDVIPSFFTNILTNNSIKNHNSVIAWYTADEPSSFGTGEKYPNKEIRWIDTARPWFTGAPIQAKADRIFGRYLLNNLHSTIKSYTPSIPILTNYHILHDFEFYTPVDISCYDMYPYSTNSENPDASTQNIIGVGTFEFESAIRYNQTAAMVWLQGIGHEAHRKGEVNPDTMSAYRTPTRENYRFSLFAPAIIGLRGSLFWRYESETKYYRQKDTLFAHADTASEEFNHYMKIFLTSPIRGKVSTSHDRFIDNDWEWSGPNSFRYTTTFQYALHLDSATQIPYLFVINGTEGTRENVEFTVFDQPANTNVYELKQDYFKNKNYRAITPKGISTQNFLTFNDSFAPYEVKIYSIGAMPRARPLMDSIAYGSLAFNGQSKLVAFPKETGSDSMVYHSVYHRVDNGRMKVFYRKSKPWIRSMGDMIIWEPQESVISESLMDSLENMGPAQCSHPSIVVRVDPADNKTKAYVVYSCYGDEYSSSFGTSQYIAEARFRVDTIVPASLNGTIIATVSGGNPNNWATPIINASPSGNFYVWSDSTRGIVGGWKPITNQWFNFTTDTVNMHWNTPIASSGTAQAQHPSTHPYTANEFQEDCSVVWQEKTSSSTNQIYYTRLRLASNGSLTYTLPGSFINQTDTVVHNTAKTIAHMSDILQQRMTNSQHTKPVIYRGPCYGAVCLNKNFPENIYWETDSTTLTVKPGRFPFPFPLITTLRNRHITHRHLEMSEQTAPALWSVKRPNKIYSFKRALLQPNVAQGTMTTTYRYPGDRPVNFNFISDTNTATYHANSRIWTIPHEYSTLLNGGENIEMPFGSSTLAQKLEAYGQYPHVAARPIMAQSSVSLPRDRRIFETGEANPPVISSSMQFFTGIQTQATRVDAFVGFQNDSMRFMISPPMIDKQELKLKFPAEIIPCSTPGDLVYKDPVLKDSIITAWFPVKHFVILDLATSGMDTGIVTIKLERKTDNVLFPIRIPVLSDSTITSTRFILRNDDSTELFRIVIARKDTTVFYTEEIALDGPIDNSNDSAGISARAGAFNESANDIAVLHLSSEKSTTPTLTLFPNPAQDYIIADIYSAEPLNGNFTVKVISVTGETVATFTTTSRKLLRIPTNTLSNGMYSVVVEHPGDIHFMKTFIIQR